MKKYKIRQTVDRISKKRILEVEIVSGLWKNDFRHTEYYSYFDKNIFSYIIEQSVQLAIDNDRGRNVFYLYPDLSDFVEMQYPLEIVKEFVRIQKKNWNRFFAFGRNQTILDQCRKIGICPAFELH